MSQNAGHPASTSGKIARMTARATAVAAAAAIALSGAAFQSSEAAQPPAKCRTLSVVTETGINLPVDATSRAVTTTRKCRGKIIVTVVRYDLGTGQRL